MPENAQNATETPGERVMRQHFQARIAERMGWFGDFLKNRQMLRDAAKKMNANLPGEAQAAEDDPMQISVGDTYVNAASQQDQGKPERTTLQKLTPLIASGLLGSGLLGGGYMVADALRGDQAEPPAQEYVDTDTQYELRLGEPEG